jgi:hypothetical protein
MAPIDKGFRMVPEAQGGTFTFRTDDSIPANFQDNADHTEMDYIGTYWCNTCVAVYFPIDKQRCFVSVSSRSKEAAVCTHS